MKSAKAISGIAFSLFFIICMLSGCANKEEMDKAEVYKGKAEPIIKQFVSENYPNYSITKIDCLFTDGLFDSKATEYISAKAVNEETDEEVKILYDIQKDETYTNQNIEDTLSQYKNAIYENLETDGYEIGVELSLVPKGVEVANHKKENYIRHDFNIEDYIIYCIVSIDNYDYPLDKIYSCLDKLDKNLDVGIKSYLGYNRAFRGVAYEFEHNTKYFIEDTLVLSLLRIDNKTTENIRDYKVIELDNSYLSYDSMSYEINTELNNSHIVAEKSSDYSNDFNVKVKNLDTNNDSIEFSVLSDKYTSVAYSVNDSITTRDLRYMTSVESNTVNNYEFSLTSNNRIKEIILALFNKDNT